MGVDHKNPFLVEHSTLIYKNPWIEVVEDRVVKQDGSKGIFGTLRMKDGVAILPISSDGHVYLAEEYKYAQGRTMIEVFGGGIEDGETVIEASARELAEEAGLASKNFRLIGVTDPFTTLVKTRDYLVLAFDPEHLENKPIADDDVGRIKVSFDEAVKMVFDGAITHTTSCLLIMMAAPLFVSGAEMSKLVSSLCSKT